jgi:hypothetical protein
MNVVTRKVYKTTQEECNVMRTEEMELFARELNEGRSISDIFFASHGESLALEIKREVQRLHESGEWDALIEVAQFDLENWSRGGKKQTHTADSLTVARISRELTNEYEKTNASSLLTANALHQAAVTYAFLRNRKLFESLTCEGKAGKKFGLVEMADRLGPALQPAGSSAYYHVKYVPYGIQARAVFGENIIEGLSLVTPDAAIESASTLINKFGVHYALAETSAAPRAEVPKSGRKPELYICTLVKGGKPVAESHQIDTPFRTEFDSKVREKMYKALRRIFT